MIYPEAAREKTGTFFIPLRPVHGPDATSHRAQAALHHFGSRFRGTSLVVVSNAVSFADS
jgi:hypothetical protein